VLHHFPADGSQWVAGISGGALRFDGLDDVVEVDGLAALTPGSPRTITAWIKLAEKPIASQTILVWGEPAPAPNWRLEVDPFRRLRFSCGLGYAIASRVVGDTEWHHLAVGVDPLVPGTSRVSDVRLCVDARLQTVYEMKEQDITACSAASLRIGGPDDPALSQPFQGVIDDVCLYDASLSPAHVRQIYYATVPLPAGR